MGKLRLSQTVKPYITLARPKHWLKNILIFVPLLYARKLFVPGLFLSTVQCFMAFCLVSSAVYIINDAIDVEKDRLHPIKKKRPIASKQIETNKGVMFSIILLTAGFLFAILRYGNYYVALFIAVYFALNLAYSFVLKHYVIVDCFCIAAGFVLRVFAGGAASDASITEWLFLTMIAASLFMAFGKRQGEITRITDTSTTRKVLANYDMQFLNGMTFVCAGLSIAFYALWAMTSVRLMVYTVPIIIFIICRYLLIAGGNDSYGDPTSTIVGDKSLITALSILVLLSAILLYL